ncbi:hypothetical protein DFH07DRAFT_773865 [Mycena maculata]|uniref:Uncharacterized protein n=1 Tax=Mycena maculata TaxID=230809 RepID=A0AAD7J4G4_9AGAR|nr:hypothetical protein DFH07DRAFT_773865 [Mycena maculata]
MNGCGGNLSSTFPMPKKLDHQGDIVGAAFGNWEKELAKECKQRTSATAKQPIDIRLVYDYAELDRTDDGRCLGSYDPTELQRSARVAARAYCLLSDAGVEPQLMLNTLEQTGAVMSSSTVGLVVTDLTFTPNDLDVYGTSAQEIVLLTILCDMEFHIDYRITETPTLHYSHKRESVVSLRTAGENGVSGGGADKSQRSGLVQQWNNNRQILYS